MEKEIVSERFVVAGKDGKPRAVFEAGAPSEEAQLTLFGTDGIERAHFGVFAGHPDLTLCDNRGKVRIRLGFCYRTTDESGEDRFDPEVTLLDERDHVRAGITLGADGDPTMIFFGKDKTPLVTICVIGSDSFVMTKDR